MSQTSVLPTYTPTYRGTDNAAALEFERLAQLLNNQIVLVPVYNVAPAKAKTGMLAYADGVNWDPASLSGSDPYLVEYVGTSWSQVTAAGGGGVSDHGALTGLSDPDHPIAAVSGLQTALDAHTTNISANTTAITTKNAVFWQATAPTATKIGDLWVDTDDDQSYVWSGSAWVSIRDSLMLQNEIDAAQAIIDAAAAQDTADGKIVTYYSASDPTGSPDFATPGVGDLWFDTDSDNELWRWSGSSWVTVQDAGIAQAIADAATAQTTADGKIVTYIQASAPVGGLGAGDIWFDSDDDNHVYRYSGSAWVSVRDQLILQNALDAAQAITDAANAQGTADSKITTFVAASAPTAEATGDIWLKTPNNTLWRWSGSAWVEFQDLDIVTALSDASNAQATADGKIVTFRQTSAPTAEGVGDLWLDSDDGDKLYRWSGSSWVDVQDSDIATAIAAASTAQATADGKVTTFYAASAPTADGVGDLWVRTTDKRLYRWSGSTWVEIQDTDIASAIANAATAQSTADGKIVTFYQSSAPTADGVGDVWFDTDDLDRPYRWNGSSWVDISWIAEIDADVTGNNTAGDTDSETGSFTATLVGVSGSPTATCYWERTGAHVTLMIPSGLTGTSTNTVLQVSGLPVGLYPTRLQYRVGGIYTNNSQTARYGTCYIALSGTINCLRAVAATASPYSVYQTSWTSSNTKGIGIYWVHRYALD